MYSWQQLSPSCLAAYLFTSTLASSQHASTMSLNVPLPVHWQMYTRGCSVLNETGYRENTLEYVWQKYHPMLPPHLHKAEYMYQALKYIHLYPRRNQCSSVLGISSSKLHSKVLPTLHILAQCLDEIHWEDRLDPFNHTPDFPLYVTGIVDTVPVYVLAPQDSTLNHWLYNPKYGGTIYKAQIGTDFMGRIILFTGPHLGNGAYDDIWTETGDSHPMPPWEYFLGDGHYTINPEVLTPLRKNGHLTDEELMYNSVFQHYRARQEHTNRVFNCHGAFQTLFRGGVDLLTDCMLVTAHTTNIELYRYVRYPPYGPWPHCPD